MKLIRVLWFILLVASAVLATSASAALAGTGVDISATPEVAAPTVIAHNATPVTPTAATALGGITSLNGMNAFAIGFDWGFSSGNYTLSWNSTGNFSVGAFNHTITGVPPGTQVFWRAFAINIFGQGNSTEQSFTTVALPFPPTDLKITQIGVNSINITWIKGEGANNTIVRGSTSGYPFSPLDGDAVYSSNGTSAGMSGLDLSTHIQYIRAWSQNDFGYSDNYTQAQIGRTGGLMGGDTTTIIGVICLGAMIAGFALSQLLILICAGIGWVAFGFLIYSTAPSNLSTALLILGIVFALVCLVWPLALVVRRRRGRPSYEDQDYKSYEERVRNITRR